MERKGQSMAVGDIKAIDIVMNLQTDEVVQKYRPEWTRSFLGGKIGAPDENVTGVTLERLVEKLDNAGIERALLPAVKVGPLGHPTSYQLPYDVVADVVSKHPDRFSGLAGIDPTEGMKGVRQMEYGIKELGF